MILDLHIDDFAIIDHLELTFHQGLVILTGETGAGKSIIIDAVETLLGSRTETTMIRAGEERAVIEASFSIPKASKAEIHTILEREDLLDDPNLLTLGREIRLNGRSVARVNGRSINVGVLKELGEYLVDVHGQSEHLSLLRVRQHLGLLDSFADVGEPLQAYRQIYKRLQNVRSELRELRQTESEVARRVDILTFQINEIEAARLQPEEEEALREERNRLANAEGLASLAQESLQLLDEGNPESPAITDLVGKVLDAAVGLARLDPSQSPLEEQTQVIAENLADLSRSLRDYLENIEFNPRRLDQVEERLNLIQQLKRKYSQAGGGTIQEILAFADQARQQLNKITHASERIAELEVEENELLQQLGEKGAALSIARHQAAHQLEIDLEDELNQLNMAGARFKVAFETRPDPQGLLSTDGRKLAFDSNGYEQVEFLVAPNPGEGLKPLVKIASGGETSRLMLAIKNVLARADQVPTLIFDEIDQGIGGRVGMIVGEKLRQLAHQHQVLCVTHLPQLAAFGAQHLQVQKIVRDQRTSTQVVDLDPTGRILELAQMMGEITEGTRHSAHELLEMVHKITKPE